MYCLFISVVTALASLFGMSPQGTLLGPMKVVKILDGDTIRVKDHFFANTIRLIGVDTPEVYGKLQPFGPEASAYTKKLLTDQEVWIELDHGEHDKYGRMLGYVYLEKADGDWEAEGKNFIQVNLELARVGLARVLTIPPNVRYKNLYIEAEAEAKKSKLNLWK
jgi:micrococcal nuclease